MTDAERTERTASNGRGAAGVYPNGRDAPHRTDGARRIERATADAAFFRYLLPNATFTLLIPKGISL